MAWTIEFSEDAADTLERMDRAVAHRLVRYLEERVAPASDPEQLGAPLRGDRAGLWRYRVGDHRIVCRIDRPNQLVTVLLLGHRRYVYD